MKKYALLVAVGFVVATLSPHDLWARGGRAGGGGGGGGGRPSMGGGGGGRPSMGGGGAERVPRLVAPLR